MFRLVLFALALTACGATPKPLLPVAPPCFDVRTDSDIRSKDAQKTLDELAKHIHLSPEDEALRSPKSLQDVRAVLRRDVIYAFADAAAFSHSLNSLDGRFSEAFLELFLGDSQLIASQILSAQEAWVGPDLRIARANLASEASEGTDRSRLLAQLIRVVEEGNKIADALGTVAPRHLARGAEVIRQLRTEAPNDRRTHALVAEYHRLRGEWTEFDTAMAAAETEDRSSPALCYLRGMEMLERYRKSDAGKKLLEDCLVKFPRFVRAQAALVLTADNPHEGMRRLAKLKEMNEDHYLVMLLEPTLAADRELLRIQGNAAH